MKKRLEEVGSLPITKIPWEYVFLGPKMLTFISRARDRPVYHPLDPGYMAQLKDTFWNQFPGYKNGLFSRQNFMDS